MRRRRGMFGMLLRNYLLFSLTLGAGLLLLLLSLVLRTNALTDADGVRFWTIVAETGILFVLLLGIHVYLYSRIMAIRITDPLRDIAEGIRSVADGQYEERLQLRASYELAQIQHSFNRMAEKLAQAERDKRQLEESKRQMLVHLSHDLKTPITTIQGYAQALQMGVIQDEAKRRRTIDLIHDKSLLVADLIDDVFQLSKMECTPLPVELTYGDIAEFVREIAVEMYDLFEERGIALECSIPASDIGLAFNRTLLYRALSNLLHNALQYNPAGTTVEVSLAEAEAGSVAIRVADDGPVIPDELKPRLFEAFVRGDSARRSDGGTGLGLTIARHIAEKHGGTLDLDPEADRTTFVLALPREGGRLVCPEATAR